MEEESHHTHHTADSPPSHEHHHAEEHTAHHEHQPEHHRASHAEKLSSFLEIKWVLLALVIIILMANVFVRTGLSKYQGLFEPDGFYYYSVIQQTIANHFVVPSVSALSGFPNHIPRAEQPGLIYVTVLPYIFLGWTGISALTIMIWIPVAYALAMSIVAFFLAKELFNSNKLGLLAMFFTSISSGAVARGAATVYRGDSFTSIFLMVSLLLLLYAYREENRRNKLIKYAASGIFLGLGYLVWTGSPFIVAVYLLAVSLMAIWGFIRADAKVLNETMLALGALLISYVLDIIFLVVGLSKRILPLQGPEFFLFFIPILAFSYLAIKMSEGIAAGKSGDLINSLKLRKNRIITIAILAIVFLGVVALLLSPEINALIGVNAPTSGNQTQKTLSEQIVQTTQEQQPPDYNFLFASFNIAMYFAPLAIILFLLRNTKIYDTMGRKPYTLAAAVIAAAIISLLVLFVYNYFNLYNYDISTLGVQQAQVTAGNVIGQIGQRPGGELLYEFYVFWLIIFYIETLVVGRKIASDRSQIITLPFIAMLSYFLITLYTQSTAIRFNALLAMPMGIFAAYGIYELGRVLYDMKIPARLWSQLAAIAIAIFVIYTIYANVYSLITDQSGLIDASGLVIAAALIGAAIYAVKVSLSGEPIKIRYLFYAAVVCLLVVNFYTVWAESVTSQQADGINPEFLGAMSWMANNTAPNSTVLALWPDGSVVEGWANRQSYMDSVGGENSTRIYNFAQYLFNTTPDSQYLDGIGKPDYIVARTFWFDEYAGVAQEGLINNSIFDYIRVYDNLAINRTPTQVTYHFYSYSYPYFQAILILSNEQNGTGFLASIGSSLSNNFAVIRHLLFYDVDNGQYTTLNSTSNDTLNYTLMVSYSVNQIGANYTKNITSAAILGPGLVDSNIFRLAYLCNFNECPINKPGSNVTVTPVYLNGDTKIYRYNYAT